MLARLGFPAIGRHRRFVTALAIDAIGSGVWMPFEILFFLKVTDLSLVAIGGAFSLGNLLGVPASLAAGTAVDRFGPKRILVLANLLFAATFALAPSAHGLPGVIAVAACGSAANSMFWSAYLPMVRAISAAGERELWFGFLGALRNVGFAVGGLAASVLLTIDTTAAFVGAAWVNAGSYLLSAFLFLTIKAGYGHVKVRASGPRQSILAALRDVGFLWFLAANTAYALCCLALNLAFPIYFTRLLDLPGWVAGTGYVVNTVLVGVGQGLVVRRMTGVARARVLQVGWLVFALGFFGLFLSGLLPVWLAVVVALVAVAIYSLGEMTSGPVLSALAADVPTEELRGRYASLFQLTWNGALIAAPALFSWLLSGGRITFWLGLTAIAAFASLVTVMMRRRLPHARELVTNSAT